MTSGGLFGHKLTQREKKIAGPVPGTGGGGLYGAPTVIGRRTFGENDAPSFVFTPSPLSNK